MKKELKDLLETIDPQMLNTIKELREEELEELAEGEGKDVFWRNAARIYRYVIRHDDED